MAMRFNVVHPFFLKKRLSLTGGWCSISSLHSGGVDRFAGLIAQGFEDSSHAAPGFFWLKEPRQTLLKSHDAKIFGLTMPFDTIEKSGEIEQFRPRFHKSMIHKWCFHTVKNFTPYDITTENRPVILVTEINHANRPYR